MLVGGTIPVHAPSSFFTLCRQLYKNYKHKSADSLSILFILQWFLGDAANLVGCFLTRQLPTQVRSCSSSLLLLRQTYTAVYFVCVDVILLTQYFYYRYRDHAADRDLSDMAGATFTKRPSQALPAVFGLFGLTAMLRFAMSPQGGSMAASRSLLSYVGEDEADCLSDPTGLDYTIGMVIGWASGATYLLSRVPQIVKNVCPVSISFFNGCSSSAAAYQ